MRPDEIRARFLMLPEELRQGIPQTDLNAMQTAIEKAEMQSAIAETPNDPAVEWKNDMKNTVENLNNLEKGVVSNSQAFNFMRYSQQNNFAPASPTDPFGAEANPTGTAAEQNYINNTNQPNNNQFNSHEDLKDELSSYGSLETAQQFNPELIQAISGSNTAQDALDRFFTEQNEEVKLNLAEMIYQNLPNNMKNQQTDTSNPAEGMTLQAPYTKANLADYLKEVTLAIKEAAEKAANEKRASEKAFNFKKYAQHKASENIIMWGPAQTRPDPFMRGQPVSDWHILERNKGFGQDIDGYWGVDWEAVWRGNIMDKYSRPYRDSETGEWIGGYIQKRFEVDKNIPVTNNYQLLPGERRRPYLPEYGSTEARLQAMRHKNDGNVGRVFNDTSAPFNWKEASAKKITKQALGNPTMEPPIPADIEQDINADLDEMAAPQAALDNMSPKDFGKALFEEWKQNPNNFDWTQLVGVNPQIGAAFNAALLTYRLTNKAAQSNVKKKQRLKVEPFKR